MSETTMDDRSHNLLPPFRQRISRRARHIRIEIAADGQVWLIIPRRVPQAAAYAFLQDRSAWIQRALAHLRAQNIQWGSHQLRWDGNDSVPLQGRDIAVHLMPSEVARPRVRIGEAIEVFAPLRLRRTPELLDAALARVLRERARQEATRLLDEGAAPLGVRYQGPRIADQRSLWGSCTPRGLISLNWRLILAPTDVFRYVVVHELCHIRHANHSPRFWQLLERQLPDYASWRSWLRVNGARLQAVLPRSGRLAQTPDLFEMHEQ
jgi:hypothetical protein